MSSKFEIAANIIRTWDRSYGSTGGPDLTGDLYEILRICHRMADTHLDASDLADAIADYLTQSFTGDEFDFDKEDSYEKGANVDSPVDLVAAETPEIHNLTSAAQLDIES